MSLAFNPNLTVIIEQLEGERAPRPLPLSNGFSRGKIYQVLGIYTASESAEALFILANDSNQIWFISNRHLRFHGIG